MDLTGYIESLTRDAESFLSSCTYLLSIIGAIRIGWLYHLGKDRGFILEESIKWIASILFLTSITAIYEKFKNGLNEAFEEIV